MRFLLAYFVVFLFLIYAGCSVTPSRAEKLCQKYGGLKFTGKILVRCNDGSTWRDRHDYYEEFTIHETEVDGDEP